MSRPFHFSFNTKPEKAYFQLLTGAVIVFTGLLSVAFLGRKLRYFQWIGMFVVITGLVIVGVSDFIGSSDSEGYTINSIITGK